MKSLQKVPVMNEVVKINFEDAVSKGPSYQILLAFLLFRFNYAFLKHKKSQDIKYFSVSKKFLELLGALEVICVEIRMKDFASD